jgi:hypothetical protein
MKPLYNRTGYATNWESLPAWGGDRVLCYWCGRSHTVLGSTIVESKSALHVVQIGSALVAIDPFYMHYNFNHVLGPSA